MVQVALPNAGPARCADSEIGRLRGSHLKRSERTRNAQRCRDAGVDLSLATIVGRLLGVITSALLGMVALALLVYFVRRLWYLGLG
jgi:hypothetical protein